MWFMISCSLKPCLDVTLFSFFMQRYFFSFNALLGVIQWAL